MIPKSVLNHLRAVGSLTIHLETHTNMPSDELLRVLLQVTTSYCGPCSTPKACPYAHTLIPLPPQTLPTPSCLSISTAPPLSSLCHHSEAVRCALRGGDAQAQAPRRPHAPSGASPSGAATCAQHGVHRGARESHQPHACQSMDCQGLRYRVQTACVGKSSGKHVWQYQYAPLTWPLVQKPHECA